MQVFNALQLAAASGSVKLCEPALGCVHKLVDPLHSLTCNYAAVHYIGLKGGKWMGIKGLCCCRFHMHICMQRAHLQAD